MRTFAIAVSALLTREVPFDPDAFSFDESRYRVEDLWEALGR